MVTKAFKARLMVYPFATAITVHPAKNTSGVIKYISGGNASNTYPGSVHFTTLQLSGGTGLSFGTGTTPPTEDDYALESKLTGGIALAQPMVPQYSVDASDNAITQILITLRNTTSAAITITEVGWVEQLPALQTQYSTLQEL